MAGARLRHGTTMSTMIPPRKRHIKQLPSLLADLVADQPHPVHIRLLFQDEGRFGRINDTRHCWAPRQIRPQTSRQVVRESIYAFGAVCPHDGSLSSLVMPWSDYETMSIFLAHTASLYPHDLCIMVLDQAGWHRTAHLRIPASIRLLWLPPYSPELNPAEHIWDHLEENWLRNTAFATLDAVEQTVCDGLRALTRNPALVKSMTLFDWINTIPLTYN